MQRLATDVLVQGRLFMKWHTFDGRARASAAPKMKQ